MSSRCAMAQPRDSLTRLVQYTQLHSCSIDRSTAGSRITLTLHYPTHDREPVQHNMQSPQLASWPGRPEQSEQSRAGDGEPVLKSKAPRVHDMSQITGFIPPLRSDYCLVGIRIYSTAGSPTDLEHHSRCEPGVERPVTFDDSTWFRLELRLELEIGAAVASQPAVLSCVEPTARI